MSADDLKDAKRTAPWVDITQGMNPSEEHILKSKDCFSEVDDINGHLKDMMSTTMLNGFNNNGVPSHKLFLKVGDICLITRAINGLGLANNSRVRITAVGRYCVEVVSVGDCAGQKVRIPRIPFKFRLKFGKSFQLTRLQFPLRLAYAMTFNKSQSQTLQKVLLDITQKGNPTGLRAVHHMIQNSFCLSYLKLN